MGRAYSNLTLVIILALAALLSCQFAARGVNIFDDSEDFEPYEHGEHPIFSSHLDIDPNFELNSQLSNQKEREDAILDHAEEVDQAISMHTPNHDQTKTNSEQSIDKLTNVSDTRNDTVQQEQMEDFKSDPGRSINAKKKVPKTEPHNASDYMAGQFTKPPSDQVPDDATKTGLDERERQVRVAPSQATTSEMSFDVRASKAGFPPVTSSPVASQKVASSAVKGPPAQDYEQKVPQQQQAASTQDANETLVEQPSTEPQSTEKPHQDVPQDEASMTEEPAEKVSYLDGPETLSPYPNRANLSEPPSEPRTPNETLKEASESSKPLEPPEPSEISKDGIENQAEAPETSSQEEPSKQLSDYISIKMILYTAFCIVCVAIYQWLNMLRGASSTIERVEPKSFSLGVSENVTVTKQKTVRQPSSDLQELYKRKMKENKLLSKRLKLAPLKTAINKLKKEDIDAKIGVNKNCLSKLRSYQSLMDKNRTLKEKIDSLRYGHLVMLRNLVDLNYLSDVMSDVEWKKVFAELKDSTFEMGVEVDFLDEQMKTFKQLTAQFADEYESLTRDIEQEKLKSTVIDERRIKLRSSLGVETES